jgi:hypothetical protein
VTWPSGQGSGSGASEPDLVAAAAGQRAALEVAGVLPAALAAFDEIAGRDALAVLEIALTPARGRAVSRAKIASALRRAGR